MASLARKLLIVAAVEGLLLLPLPPNGNGSDENSKSRKNTPVASRPSSPALTGTIRIDYKSTNVRKLLSANDEHRKERDAGLEVHGIAGLFSISPTTSFLIAITSRQQVAIINKSPIYVITDVTLIPLSSQSSAQDALTKARAARAKHDGEIPTDITDDEEGSLSDQEEDKKEQNVPPIASGGIGSAKSSTEEQHGDTVGRKGVYGLFAQKWFSKTGWTAEKKPRNDTEGNAKSAEGLKSSMEWTDDEPGNQDVKLAPPPKDQIHESDVPMQADKSAPPPTSAGAKPENKPAPELESFPALPLSEEEQAEQSAIAEEIKETTSHRLTPKLLHTTKLLFASSRSFFFSYDMDITRSWGQLQQQPKSESSQDAPLWMKVDPLYFWNRHLLQPFISANQHSFILPLMQGFIGQKTFYAPVSSAIEDRNELESRKSPFILTLISRRSTKRAGLRYLRRGVDSAGNTANCVETEQLLSIPVNPSITSAQTPSRSEVLPDQLPWGKTYSFLQIRGSIPVYFQQSPYALRPKPVLLHSEASNRVAFERHFNNLEKRYNSDILCLNLVERGSAENIVGEKYEKYVADLNAKRQGTHSGSRKVGFNWFDFHRVCRGMKFEKVALLLDEIEEALEGFGWTETVDAGAEAEARQGTSVKCMQKGIVRTNCMDCLDRTNVVQSACGRRALEKQLQKEGVDISNDPTDWFNIVWADNGDAISKQYASTAALKGDFTRTRKRNYRGALADFRLTMTRYFTNIISDFFTQAAIDYLLGNVSSRVFDEFEVEMMSKDPATEAGGWGNEDRVSGIRANAIEVSSKIVIEDADDEEGASATAVEADNVSTTPRRGKETLIKGWTFLTPHEENTIRTFPFEETVVLLTNRALYSCRFDFAMEKVSSFERVDLRCIRELQIGTYITSTLAPSSMEEESNVGFVVKFVIGGDIRRVNTRTVKSRVDGNDVGYEEGGISTSSEGEGGKEDSMRIIAFKALPRTSAIKHMHGKEKDQVTKQAGLQLAAKDRDENLEIPAREQLRSVCLRIEKAVLEALPDGGEYLVRKKLKERGVEVDGEQKGEGVLINEEDIISLAQAKKKTGLLEMWGYQVRRLVWA
ncbi:SacI homology domain-containing protein [Kalaharituber pfeilii]|nr:SacI homology domain-containing protein [Kalaharituber pfeilii]